MFSKLPILLISFIFFSCSSSNKNSIRNQKTNVGKAVLTVDHMSSGDYQKAKVYFNKTMSKALSDKMISNVWERLLKKNGKYLNHRFSNEDKKTVFIRVEFEKAFHHFRIKFDKNDEVSGLFTGAANKKEKNIASFKSFDGFELPYLIERPSGKVRGVFIYLHGSGPNGMDGTDTKLFVQISKVLKEKGFASLRYNKRSYEINKLASMGSSYLESSDFKKFDKDFYLYFLKDANAVVDFATKKFPGTPLYIYGLSQGANLALQLTTMNKNINGLVLTGFSTSRINETILYQYVFRNDYLFYKSDKNNDRKLCHRELSKNLKAQLSMLDMNDNKCLDLDEYRAGNYSNVLAQPKDIYDNWLRNELSLKRPTEILKQIKVPVLFFHGSYDHQTPVYQLKSLQVLNNLKWKNDNLNFTYLSKRGHILNDQKELVEYNYTAASKKTLNKLSGDISKVFKANSSGDNLQE
ncbi:MAG: DUF3887 domain-containing protein [Bacteriovoracaceae bacterium]|nr:DUF3887 domain-containing protein [Bacteriovoracaceae bacterium]